VIAEKTGYPVEMLELGMSLDADLGIDSIKRVEILSALQERLPELPAVKPEHLGTLQTIDQIVDCSR
jgi:acyl carrier protein